MKESALQTPAFPIALLAGLLAGCYGNFIHENRYFLTVSGDVHSTGPYYAEGTIDFSMAKEGLVGGGLNPKSLQAGFRSPGFRITADPGFVFEKAPGVWTEERTDSLDMEDTPRIVRRFRMMFPPGKVAFDALSSFLRPEVEPPSAELYASTIIIPLGYGGREGLSPGSHYDTIVVSEEVGDIVEAGVRHIRARHVSYRHISVSAVDRTNDRPISGVPVTISIGGRDLDSGRTAVAAAIAATLQPAFPPLPPSMPHHVAVPLSRELCVERITGELLLDGATLCAETAPLVVRGVPAIPLSVLRTAPDGPGAVTLTLDVTAAGYERAVVEAVVPPHARFVDVLLKPAAGPDGAAVSVDAAVRVR